MITLYDMMFPPRCPYCGTLLGEIRESCGKCDAPIDAKPITQTLENGVKCVSAFDYSGKCRNALLKFKYYGGKQYGKPFALTLARVYETLDGSFDVCTSVPAAADLSGTRFDQTKMLAKNMSKQTGVPYERLLIKTAKGRTQHTLGKAERAENVRGLYREKSGAEITGRRVLLLDDIVTTGSTLKECSNVLLDGGASGVFCLTLAWR